MKQITILGISPYEGLSQIMENISAQYDVVFINEVGDLEEGLKAFFLHSHEEIDCVISRGETAQLIRSHSNLPVYSVDISISDVLRTIQLAKSLTTSFAIVGFHSVASRAKDLSGIIHDQFPIYEISNEQELSKIFTDLKREGIDLIIGDMVTTVEARKYEYTSLLVTSGVESVRAAFSQTLQMSQYFRQSNQALHLTNRLLQQSPVKVLVFDHKENLFYQSTKDISKELLLFLRKNLPELFASSEVTLVYKTKSHYYKIQGQLLYEKQEAVAVYYIYSTKLHTSNTLPVGIKYNNYLDVNITSLLSICSATSAFTEILHKIEKMDKVNLPILILGEYGTLHDSLAQYAYTNSSRRINPMLELDFSEMNAKTRVDLLTKESSPLLDNALTVYFKNIQVLDRESAEELLNYISTTSLAKRCNVIFSFQTERNSAKDNLVVQKLLQEYRCHEIQTIPLRKISAQIPNLIGMYISDLNLEFSIQPVGFSKGAIQQMQQYVWPGNFPQFYRTIRTLATQTESYYISEKEVKDIILSEKNDMTTQQNFTGIENATGTLSEITTRIVFQVLTEENMNQTRTAKRLGISRSTLWRILKESSCPKADINTI